MGERWGLQHRAVRSRPFHGDAEHSWAVVGGKNTVIPEIIGRLRTPCYVLDTALLKRNLQILARIQERTGCKILLALKGFAFWNVFPLMRNDLAGIAASSLHEARLGREEFGKEVHLYAPAYRDDEIGSLLELSDCVVFNSFSQWRRFREQCQNRDILYGLRINPEHSETSVSMYDPCASGSRFGIPLGEFDPDGLEGITGLHFHTLCQSSADALERTLKVVESKFGAYLHDREWVSFGGGHFITSEDYDVDQLCRMIDDFQSRYDVLVYLEPSETIALNCGFLVSSVLDVTRTTIDTVILDTSAVTHIPDVLEMPYRPAIEGAGEPGQYPHTYRLGGISCLSGDVIGDYSFPKPLNVGDKLVFHDMAAYTMVKNNTFNGISLPDIVHYDSATHLIRVVRSFSYQDYKNRLS